MINIDQYYNEYASIVIPQNETMQLFKMWHETNDNSYREKIILGNMGIIEDIAGKVTSIDPVIDKEDILQSGMIGLIRAVDTFDYQNKRQFIQYANIIIYRAVNGCIYKDKYIDNTEPLDAINIEEIKDSSITFEEDIIKYLAMYSLIDPILNKIKERDRSIIIDYFGLYKNNCLNQKDISKKYNISRGRSRQIIYKAMRRLKRLIMYRRVYNELYLSL